MGYLGDVPSGLQWYGLWLASTGALATLFGLVWHGDPEVRWWVRERRVHGMDELSAYLKPMLMRVKLTDFQASYAVITEWGQVQKLSTQVRKVQHSPWLASVALWLTSVGLVCVTLHGLMAVLLGSLRATGFLDDKAFWPSVVSFGALTSLVTIVVCTKAVLYLFCRGRLNA